MKKQKELITWHSFSLAEVYKRLQSREGGLTTDELKRKQLKVGANELPREKKLTKFKLFLSQFNNSLIYILLAAGVVSFFLGEHVDAYVILAAVLINVIVGFFQENRAQNALDKLRQVVVPETMVIRDGSKKIIKATELVPGDIIVIKPGDRIPADARLIEAYNLELEEAALTGESAPVKKVIKQLDPGLALADRKNMVYMGTLVSQGVGQAIVTSIGISTEIGKIAQMLNETVDEDTPLQKKLSAFSRKLGAVILLISAAIFILGILADRDLVQMLNTAVAVAVSAIPEGMVVAVTIILAIGMQRILKEKALVKKLVVAETLGSTTVICTDKTGTLTEGQMRVSRIITADEEWDFFSNSERNLLTGSDLMNVVKIATICNDAEFDREGKVLGSATEKALLLAGSQIGLLRNKIEQKAPRIDEIPFDSSYKFMATVHKLAGKKNIVYLKGAPEFLLAKADFVLKNGKAIKLSDKIRQELKKKIHDMTSKQLRVIAVGYSSVAKDFVINTDNAMEGLIFAGVLGLKDPLRFDSKETLEITTRAGIKTVIITGDNKETARAIALDLGIKVDDDSIMEGNELLKLADEELVKVVKKIIIYARVTPHDKLRIVKAWQAHGDVVAMTGDGINDAPALKQADIGVAVGSGTDVAKETADLVLLNDNYSAIVAAVEQGRVMYDNIKKVVLYLLSDSFSEVFLIVGTLAMGWPLPLLPAQILWINLVADGFPYMALTLEPEEKEIMNEPPQERNKPILDGERNLLIMTISIVTALASILIFYFYNKAGNLDLARTVVFAGLGFDSLFYVFSCRSMRHSIFNKQFYSNKYLLGATFMGILLLLAAVYIPFLQTALRTVPLRLEDWLVVLSMSALVVICIEFIKWIFIVRHKKA